MKRMISLFLLLMLLASCAAPAGKDDAQAPDAPEAPADAAPEEDVSPEADGTEDHVLLTLEAPLADGRTLTLEAAGRVLDEYSTGVREVRVYDGDALIQTVQAREGNLAFWGDSDLLPGESVSEYTSCWSPEGCMTALDLNFDGSTDFGLFAFSANNTIPYYYWMWDSETEQYRYAFTLHEAEVLQETRELTSEYKSGSAGSQWIVEYYKPDGNGNLYLDRLERETCDFEPASGQLDSGRGWAEETWVPPEDKDPIPPEDGHWGIESDLLLIRREFPVLETNADGTVSRFTELWELQDGEFQMTSREEFFYDGQQP